MYGGASVTPLGRGNYNSQQCTSRHTVEYAHLRDNWNLVGSSLSKLHTCHPMQLSVLPRVACVLVTSGWGGGICVCYMLVTSGGEEASVCDLEILTRSRISCNARFVSSSSSSM